MQHFGAPTCEGNQHGDNMYIYFGDDKYPVHVMELTMFQTCLVRGGQEEVYGLRDVVSMFYPLFVSHTISFR